MKTLAGLLILTSLSLSAQQKGWFIGAQLTPQQSFIFNRNDRLAAKVPSGSDIPDDGLGHSVYNMKPDNNEFIIPNSVSAGPVIGYRFSEWFSLESGLTYSFQQQKFDQNINEKDSYVKSRNTLHLAKLPLIACFSAPLTEFSFVDLSLGIQPVYAIAGTEIRNAHFLDGWSESGYKDGVYFGDNSNNIHHKYKPQESIYEKWNVEATAAVSIRFSISHSSELYLRLRADRSLLDIERKSVIIQNSNGEEVRYYERHSPFRFVSHPTDCPDCEPDRPPSYNFTAGLSIGYIYYFD